VGPPGRQGPRPDAGRPAGGIPAPHLPPRPSLSTGDDARSSRPPFRNFSLDSQSEPAADSVVRPGSSGKPPAPAAPQPRAEPGPAAPPVAVLSALKAGETVSGFLLLSELGRGAFARVFLAEQVDLGRRRVALKISRAEGDEPQILARLQHANIVPIHSLHDDPATGLRLLCMPYFGGANLAQVLETAVGRRASQAQDLSLVDALDEVSMRFQPGAGRLKQDPPNVKADEDRAGQGSGSTAGPFGLRGSHLSGVAPGPCSQQSPLSASVTTGSRQKFQSIWNRLLHKLPDAPLDPESLRERDFDQPARQFLRQADTVKAAVWIIARLAEGLEHAHTRGLLHRDIKPSNILIAGDGTPMLLDFNLSTDAKADDPSEGEKAMLGGTLPYMAPEHLAAFDPRCDFPGAAVDERSDLYSLGLILFEILAGAHPFPEPPIGTPLLEVISLMARQRRTIPSVKAANPLVPWSLESITRKCLDPNPGRRYVRARDLAEDLKRYLEDLPLKHAPELSLRERGAKWMRRNPRICNGTSIAAFATLLIIGLGGLMGLLANNVQNLSARLKYQSVRTELDECRFLLNHMSGPTEHLDRGLSRAVEARKLIGLTPSGRLPDDSWAHRLEPEEVVDLRGMASELILLETRSRVDLAGKAGTEADRKAAIEWALSWLDAAEALDPAPPAALYDDRARYHAALGRSDLAARDREAGESHAPRTARDFLLLGTGRLAHGDLPAAEDALAHSAELNPRSFWAWFTLGLCHLEAGRYADAAGDFSAAVAIEPGFAWPYLNRGLALARSGRLDDARRAYGLALKRNPRFSEAWLNLALASLELNDLAGADAALCRAIKLGREEPAVLAALAEVKSRLGDRDAARLVFDRVLAEHPDDPQWLAARGISRISSDPEGARADLEHAIKVDRHHARAHYGLALLRRKDAPAEALALADAALADDPGLLDALQLRALLRARLGDLRAVEDAERLCLVPTPHRLYNAACVFALLADSADQPNLKGRALGSLDRALDAGFPAGHAAADQDLKSLFDLPEFRNLLAKRRPPGAF